MAKFCADCKKVKKFDITKEPCGSCYYAVNTVGVRTKPNFKGKGNKHA